MTPYKSKFQEAEKTKKLVTLSPANIAKFEKALTGFVKGYLSELKENGLDGDTIKINDQDAVVEAMVNYAIDGLTIHLDDPGEGGSGIDMLDGNFEEPMWNRLKKSKAITVIETEDEREEREEKERLKTMSPQKIAGEKRQAKAREEKARQLEEIEKKLETKFGDNIDIRSGWPGSLGELTVSVDDDYKDEIGTKASEKFLEKIFTYIQTLISSSKLKAKKTNYGDITIQ